MNDEPERFTPPRPAIPVRTKQEQRVADAEREAADPMHYPGPELHYKGDPLTKADLEKGLERSLRAKKAWQTRRANRTVESTPRVWRARALNDGVPLPDRHRPAVFTAKEAVELARLMVDYPFLRKLVE